MACPLLWAAIINEAIVSIHGGVKIRVRIRLRRIISSLTSPNSVTTNSHKSHTYKHTNAHTQSHTHTHTHTHTFPRVTQKHSRHLNINGILQVLIICWDGRPCQSKVGCTVAGGAVILSVGELSPHLIAWAETYLRTKWNRDPSSRLVTIDMGRKCAAHANIGPCCAPFRRGTGSLSNTMWIGPRLTSVPSGILIHSTVWPHIPRSQIGQTGQTTVR